jgi:hypothetical protein
MWEPNLKIRYVQKKRKNGAGDKEKTILILHYSATRDLSEHVICRAVNAADLPLIQKAS